MTTTTLSPLSSAPIPSAMKKKRVLLVDTSSHMRELRAEVMRKLGMDVDCAVDIAEARSWWRADLYNLVLIDTGKIEGNHDRFCEDVRGATPAQQLAFLVGKPQYLSNAPNVEEDLAVGPSSDHGLLATARTALAARTADLPQNWGILEASRRISAVRSASVIRTRALRDRPLPPRDSEERYSKQATIAPNLDDLLRKEMQ